MSEKITKDDKVEQVFPAPSFREKQKPAVEEITKGFENGADVVLFDAPPGMGKSVCLYSVLEYFGEESFYLTPLKVLQDQLINDEFMGNDLVDIRGRANYSCILPDAEPGTTVDKAKCQKDSSFDCDIKDSCPYYAQKMEAISHDKTVMNLSYFMAEGRVDPAADLSFGSRPYIIIDEVQGLEDWALNFVGFTLSKFNLPNSIQDSFDFPDEEKCENLEYMVKVIEDQIVPAVEEAVNALQGIPNFSDDELDELERLSKFQQKVDRFLRDVRENHWTSSYEYVIRKNRDNYKKVTFEPVRVGRFLDDLVWSRGEKFILSSATIPKGNWIEHMGLGDKRIKRVRAPSTFPVENRPIITGHTVGKMTYNKREENMPDAVAKVKKMSDHHEGEKGLVHCRGYNYIKLFRQAARNNGYEDWYRNNVYEQDRNNREESLEDWINSDKQLFMSVNMTEGIDLKGDKCRWQVVLKGEYPNMGSDRVSHIVNELEDWTWYNNKAVIALEQAYGRAVRSKDDEAIMYILDDSVINMIKMNAELFHGWFLEAIKDMPIDPERAGGG